MSENFVSILGGRYITNGHVVKNASPYSLNPNPIAQVVVGGQVGYHLKFNKKRVFYSVDLIKAMYQQEAGNSTEVKTYTIKLNWKFFVTIGLILFILSVASCNINVKVDTQDTAQGDQT